MIYYPLIEDLKKYRDTDYLSQTFLKRVLSNSTKPFKESIQSVLGSYVDCLLTSPQLVNDLFQQELDKRPSDTIKEIFIELFESLDSALSLESYRDEIIQICRNRDYQRKWGDDAIWNSILKEESYWNQLVESNGRTIITRDEIILSNQIASLTLSSPITGKYFIDQKNVDKYFQKDIYWITEDEPCKGLIDLLIIEHETKTIYLIDIKTTGVGSLEEWFRIANQKGYNFQMSFYKEGLIQNYSDLIEDGYTIQCKWIVIPMNTERFKPWVIPCTPLQLKVGKEGYTEFTKDIRDYQNIEYLFGGVKEYKGWVYAIQQYRRGKSERLLDFDLQWFDYQGRLPSEESDKLFFR